MYLVYSRYSLASWVYYFAFFLLVIDSSMQSDIAFSCPVSEYLLVLEPNEHLCDEIMQVKKYFGDTYDCVSSAAGKPNITLVRFQQYDMMEPRILHRLQLVAAEQSSFLVELHDFGSFPSHTIFLKITTQSQIIELVKSFRPIQHLLKMDKEHKPHFITEPYICIARKLLPWQYEKGWLELSHTHFSGRFLADHFLLLRKREGENKFEMVKKIKLLNRKISTIQGELFV